MKKLYLFTLLALFSSAMMFGQTNWSPGTDGLWSVADNWSTSAVPTDADEVRIGNPFVCTIDADAVFGQIKMGIGGEADVIVKEGITVTGSSTVSSWSSIGENSAAKLTIEKDALFDLGEDHAWIGRRGGDATIDIFGTLSTNVALGIDRSNQGAICIVTIHPNGQLKAGRIGGGIEGIGKDGILDIRGGTLSFGDDESSDLAGHIASGKILAYGGGGIVKNEVVDGKSVVTSEEDPSAPTIASSSPADGETGVPGELPIIITFSKWMDHVSVEAALTITPAIASPTYTWSANTLTITGDPMTAFTTYTVTIGTGATDVNAIAVASELSFSFQTIDPDAPPIVVTTVPADGATDINEGAPIVVNFSKAMDSTSVAAAFTVVPALVNPDTTWSNDYKTLSIAHDNLDWMQVSTVTVAAGAKALDDETVLAADYTFTYTVRGQPLTTIVWNPAQDGSSDGLWTTPENWTLGEVPDGNYKVVTNVPGAGSIHLNDSVNVNHFVLGDNVDGDTLFIGSEGYLKTHGGWCGFGYYDTAVVVIETGGTLDLNEHAWIGLHDGALGIVDVYGEFIIKGATGLNWADDGGIGVVTVHEGGVLNMRNLQDFAESGKESASIHIGSVIDVNGGEWIINRHDGQKAVAKQYIEAGRITGYGGTGFVRVSEDSVITDVDTTLLTVITSTMTRNSDATLKSLTSDVGGTFSPAFDPAVTTYDLVVPMGSFWATIGGTATDVYASVSEDVFVDLSLGSGQAVLTCTAEDGSTQDYTVNITVSEVSVETDLSELIGNAFYIPSLDVVRVENAASVEMIRVFDITGKLRVNEKVNSSETYDIDASALYQGLYIIQLKSSDSSRQSFKFIK